MSWKERRIAELTAQMQQATESRDKESFQKAYTTAMNYMPKRDLAPIWRNFIKTMAREGRR